MAAPKSSNFLAMARLFMRPQHQQLQWPKAIYLTKEKFFLLPRT
jgi:hypothetical protein